VVDLASPVLGGFQDMIVEAFGATAGWWIGNILVVGILVLSMVAIQNRQHIVDNSGFGRGTLLDITVIIVLAAFQYGIFTGSFGWPEDVSLALAVISTYTLRWHIVILDRAQSRRVSP